MDVLIGVAWPYASGPRHLGHLAGAYLPADVAARHHRLAGDRVLLVSGSDQHGTPITVAAERAGLSPAALADREHERIAASFARAGISFDHYTRTATPRPRRHPGPVHQPAPARAGRRGATAGAFCPRGPLPARPLRRGGPARPAGHPTPVATSATPAARPSTRRSWASPAAGAAAARPRGPCASCSTASTCSSPRWRGTWTGTGALAAVRGRRGPGWLARGAAPGAITRDLDWGVPSRCPAGTTAGCIVWFDAVIGYLSASVEWAESTGAPGAWRAVSECGPRRPAPLLRQQGTTSGSTPSVAGHPARRRPGAAPARRGGRQPPPDPAHRGTTRGRGEAVGQPGTRPHDRGGHRAGRARPAAPRPVRARAGDGRRGAGLGQGGRADGQRPARGHRWPAPPGGHPAVAPLRGAARPGRPWPPPAPSGPGRRRRLAEVGRPSTGPERRALGAVPPSAVRSTAAWTVTEPGAPPRPDAPQAARLLPLLDASRVAAWPFVPGTAAGCGALLGRPARASRRLGADPGPGR
jgi:hypothetical protein